MRVGLIDVDGHNFPNLALMRIAAYHKSHGDTVEWWWTDFIHYDIVYKSKVFSEQYSKDVPDPINADTVVRGGTGYAIKLRNGKEVFDESAHTNLPDEIERMSPDYSIYPQYKYALSITTRGCPRGCPFCIVGKKEGRCSRRVADVDDYWKGQKEIVVLDPNTLACKERDDILKQYARTKAWCGFSQGLDARMLDKDCVDLLNLIKIKRVHFAWDQIRDEEVVIRGLGTYAKYGNIQDHRRRVVYVLTNYNTTHEEDLYRVYKLRDLGFDPDVRVYDKPHATKITKQLQRWCNSKWIFQSVPDFNDYGR